MALSDAIGAATDYLWAGPELGDFLYTPMVASLRRHVEGLDHVGLCVRPYPDDYVTDVLRAAGYGVVRWFPSCFSSVRKIVRAEGRGGTIELAFDDVPTDPPHVAWRVRDQLSLMHVGEPFATSRFGEPDHMKSRVAFNLSEGVMFRYFEGMLDGTRIRLEFCL